MPKTSRPRRRSEIQEYTPAALKKMINKEFGAGTMKVASDPSLIIERVPTGILSVDFRLGGGFARNRVHELYGSAAVGKNTVAQHLIASCQATGGRAAFIDAEATFDPIFASGQGVDLDTLDYHRQQSGNRCVDFMETLLSYGIHDVIVLDSIAALIPQYEVENNMDAGSYGAEQAKMMSKALRKLTTANKNTVLVFINQTRESIGQTFGKKLTTPGGRAMGFYAGTRMELVRTEAIRKKGSKFNTAGDEVAGDVVIGHRVLFRIEKDKTGGARPYDEGTFVFDYNLGDIDPIEDLIYLGRVLGYITKNGSDKWYVDGYEDEQLHGRPRFKKWLQRNVAVAEELEEMIRAQIGQDPEEDEIEEDE